MPNLRAEVLRDDAAWDTFVRAAGDATFCHLAGWRRIVEDTLGHEFIPLVAVDDAGSWQGVLPLVRIRTTFIGHSLISVPFLNYGGPLGSTEACQILIDAAVAEARRSGAGVLQLRSRTPLPRNLRVSDHKVLVALQLPETADALMAGFPAKLRSQVRRPLKDGLEFRSGPGELDAFYQVFARNMRDLGTPVYSPEFFRHISRTFDEIVIGVVYVGNVPVAGGLGFLFNGEFEITWASTIREYNRLSPNMLLYWRFMEEVIRRGGRVFNFGRSTPGASTHRFKMQWGGTDHDLPWAEWHARAADHEDGTGPGTLARAASSVWKRLPLPLANFLGPRVARRLPWW